MDNTNFSLCQLPDDARLHVIKILDYLELISFSFTSSKSKLLVKSINIPMEDLVFTIDDQLYITPCPTTDIEDSTFYIYENQEMGNTPRRLDVVSDVILVDQDERWENLGLSCKELFQHLLSLFKFNETSLFINNETEAWDSADLQNLVRKWDLINIENASDTYLQKLGDTVIPLAKAVTVENKQEIIPVFPQKIGIQNLELLNIHEHYNLKLDDALVMNSRRFRIHQLSTKETNRFFKSWIRGSNPRMTRLSVHLNEEVEEEVNQRVLLKGLKYQVMPAELERRIDYHPVIIGGFDIRNKQGKLASIQIRGRYVDFVVWDP